MELATQLTDMKGVLIMASVQFATQVATQVALVLQLGFPIELQLVFRIACLP